VLIRAALVAEHDLDAAVAWIIGDATKRVVHLLDLSAELRVVDLQPPAPSRVAVREVVQQGRPTFLALHGRPAILPDP
jgi:hypothetical protein